MPDGTNCSHPLNSGRYIEEFTCSGDSSDRMLKEMRLSFPSGHSSFSFFTMVYCAVSSLSATTNDSKMSFYSMLFIFQIYLQTRMTWRGSKLLKHFLQYTLVMITWFTSLSRISDYKHHWSDVMAGAFLGVIMAVLVANFVNDLGCRRPQRDYLGPTRYELGTHTTNNGTVPA